MFIAALAHQVAFPASEFADAAPAEGSKLSSVLDVLDMSDVFLDVKDRAESMGGRMVGRLMKDASGAMGGGARSKVKLDVADDELGDGDTAAVRLLPLGERSEGGDGVVGGVELRADRDNMPFLAAGSGHQRRTGAAGAAADGGESGLTSPRGQAPAAAMSTVSIGGVQVPLKDLLATGDARSPRPSSAAAGPARAAALIASAAKTCALAP
jgi:hypothetical protein